MTTPTALSQYTPEVLYGDTIERASACEAQAHRYAEAGHVYGAVAATWAADMAAVQAVMWERVMVASPQPDKQFFDIATTVTRAMALYAAAAPEHPSAREAIAAARTSLELAFDDAAVRLLHERFIALDHLDGMPAPGSDAPAAMAADRLGGESVDALIAARRQTARDCMQVALGLSREGHAQTAMQQAWQADWAILEAYLLEAARAVGDDALVTVDIRWEIAKAASAKIAALPADFAEAVGVVRARLAQSLGTIEGSRLAARFEPLV